MPRALGSAVAAALLIPVGSIALAQRQPPAPRDTAPFVEISIRGSEVVSPPQRILYRVSADAGSYVTVFEISPLGRVFILNAYDDGAVRGNGRAELFREAYSAYEDGEGYLVAVATRSKADHSQLLKKSRSRFSWASRFATAESSLNDLLITFLPATVKEFGADFAAFRVLTFAGLDTYADALYCPLPFYSRNGYLSSWNAYLRGYGYHDPADSFSLRSFSRLNSEGLCYDSQRADFLVARAPFPAPPSAPTDTASKSDTTVRLSPPHTFPYEPPVSPPGRASVITVRGGTPIGEPPTVPVERDDPPLGTFSRPAAPSMPAQPVSPPRLEPPVALPATPTSAERVRRDPVVEAPDVKPFRPIPVETERREPTQPAPPRIETPAMPVMSPPPPAPAPAPPPRPVAGGDAKVLQPTTIPPG